jgi:dolichol-phosphate mannosyltransferase
MGKNKKIPYSDHLVSVVLPTYNERDNIVNLIRELLKHLGENVELIVSDDNSPDGTGQVVKSLKIPQVRLITRYKNKGLGPAIFDGIRAAKGKYIVWMDCDLTMPPSLVPKMLKELKNYDVVVGSRYAKGGADKRSFIRVATSIGINRLANLILNFKVLDYDSGFVAARREVFDKVKFEPKGHGEYCIEFLYKCTKQGYKIKEIGYVFREREVGESKTVKYVYSVFLHGFRYAYRILKVRLVP